jgi:hypothetical protein
MGKNYLCPICETPLKGQRYCPECHRLIKEPTIFYGKYLPNQHTNRCIVPKTEFKRQTPSVKLYYDSKQSKKKKKSKDGIALVKAISFLIVFIILFSVFISSFTDSGFEVDPDDYGENSEFVEYILDHYTDVESDEYSATYTIDADTALELGVAGTGYECFDKTYDQWLECLNNKSVGLENTMDNCRVTFYDSENYRTYFERTQEFSIDNCEVSVDYDVVSGQIIQISLYQNLEENENPNYEIPTLIADFLVSDKTISEEDIKALAQNEEKYIEDVIVYLSQDEDSIYWSFE